MRTILVTPSGYGHLHPLIPLARALEAAGHTVTVATTGGVVEEVRRLGIDARSVGPPSDPPPFRSFGGPAIDSLLAMSEELEPDVFGHDHTVAAAGVPAELRGVPNVYTSVGTMRPPWMMESIEAWFAPVWQRYGLEQPAHAGLFRYLYLDRCPPSLQPPEIRAVESAHAIRPVNFDGADPGALPSWTRGLGDRPVVYVTFGTAFNSPEMFAPVLEALRNEPLELIVTVGRNLDPAELGHQPPNVHVERYLAQSLVLPLCDAVLCHGGSGSIMETLTCGLPMVILPQGRRPGLERPALCRPGRGAVPAGRRGVRRLDSRCPRRGARRRVLSRQRRCGRSGDRRVARVGARGVADRAGGDDQSAGAPGTDVAGLARPPNGALRPRGASVGFAVIPSS